MLTRIAPTRAVANCTTTHSAQFGAQMPTRSPFSTPAASRPRAHRSTWASSSAYVQRTPCARETSASRAPCSETIAFHISPIVSPRSGTSETPCWYARLIVGCRRMLPRLPQRR